MRGYFDHITMTYDIIVPHLRGFHNAIDSWRDKRTTEGWKDEQSDFTQKDALATHTAVGKILEETCNQLLDSQSKIDEAPKCILPIPRLFHDLKILETIFQGSTPAHFPIRFKVVAEIVCGFGDASSSGLCSMMQGNDEF